MAKNSTATTTAGDHQFKRNVSLFDGIMLVSGSMIGSGIFLTSAEISRTVGGMGWVLVVWIIGGLMTMIAASSYGELAALFPKAGGEYVYLREAYNPLVSFLYGWSFFAVISSGTIAAVAVAFAKYLAFLVPGLGDTHILFSAGSFHIAIPQVIAISTIVILSYINTFGINKGKTIQSVFTVAKILALAGLIIFGLLTINTGILSANWADAWKGFQYEGTSAMPIPIHGIEFIGLIGVAMVGSLFSSDAWHSVASIASEVKNPRRNVGRSLFLGTLLVTIVYTLMNVVYVSVLSMHDIAFAPSDRVAASAALSIFGGMGAIIIAVMILVSTFGCNNGLILAGARVYYSMAKDGLFFPKTGKLNKNGVPAYAIWIQCIWASILCLSGSYSALLNYIIFVVLLFYILTIIGIYILRKKRPDLERKVKAPGYPVLPAIYVILAAAIVVSLFILRPVNTWPGLLLVIIGIPLYYFMKKKYQGKIE